MLIYMYSINIFVNHAIIQMCAIKMPIKVMKRNDK